LPQEAGKVPLRAEIHEQPVHGESRASSRRTLRLRLPTQLPANATEAVIHNLSERGLLIETASTLALGDTIEVELPEAGNTAAHVVWVRDDFAGCEFVRPLPKAALSAALLRSPDHGATPAMSALPHLSEFKRLPNRYAEPSSSLTPVLIAVVVSLLITAVLIGAWIAVRL
jgi:hypothetical protein